MSFDVHVAHIYQRRFEVEDLRNALSSSHWYIISRCPRVRIIDDSIRIDDDIVSVKVAIHRQDKELIVEPLVLDTSPYGSVTSFESHLDGAYFTMVVGNDIIHGDAWSLTSLVTRVRVDIAGQEVLYVGHSFAEGKSDASRRTAQHKTLQKIYEDHGGSTYDVFVSPLKLGRRSWSGDDHIDDAEDGPDFQLFYEHFAEMNGPIKQRAVDLIEHALIAYFDPPYNQKLRHWNPVSPTKAMRSMREVGLRLLVVNLSGENGLARFYSHLVSDTFRSHLICHDIPPAPARPQLRGVAAESVSSWRPAGQIVRHGRQLFANLGEFEGIALQVFGDEAPSDRRPPEVLLPDVTTAGQSVSRPLPSTRAADRVIKKKRRQIEEKRRSRRLPMRPTYKNGTIRLGTLSSGEGAFWSLYDKVSQVYEHGFVLGGREGGEATTFFALIAHEATRSRNFTVISVDRSLTQLVNALKQRTAEKPGHRRPGLVALIPDVDTLVANETEIAALNRVLRDGRERGVAVVMGIENLDMVVERVGRIVIDVRNQYSMTPDGQARIGSAKAGLRTRRTTTQGDPGQAIFLLTAQGNNDTVSELVDTFDAQLSFDEVRKTVAEHVTEAEVELVMNWKQQQDLELWTASNALSANFWTLRRHDDAWALCRELARIRGGKPSRRSEQLSWAEAVLLRNYEMPSALSGWQPGPTVAGADETLYCSMPRASCTPIPRTSVLWDMSSGFRG